jgi:hypothetical protein
MKYRFSIFAFISFAAITASAQQPPDFNKQRAQMFIGLRGEVESKTKAKQCLMMKTIPATEAAACEREKQKLIADLDLRIRMAQAGMECLKKSGTFQEFTACQKNAMTSGLSLKEALK